MRNGAEWTMSSLDGAHTMVGVGVTVELLYPTRMTFAVRPQELAYA
jgi:hypothetical protein